MGFPKKKDVCEVCLLMGLMTEGRWGTRGGGILSPGVVAIRPNILLSSVVGESLVEGRGLLIAGSSPPLPSGTPLKLSPTQTKLARTKFEGERLLMYHQVVLAGTAHSWISCVGKVHVAASGSPAACYAQLLTLTPLDSSSNNAGRHHC